ncbi:MAG: hypothetical protein DWQ47_01255 [Acidobacteria bacterium]|nr:MAG: hypothetical protein DWQ32_11715 [Acidobacteriota bacterium]REK04128.1 MAG: hypothetical protein DWQ38_01240 [Acidobacteriota bacterium]REK15290.1 MAG: hypothetical protein DWQ43_17405 [Acidobacteriota bacterium]REK46380.1 MAG: hypothetical protein DWQ47_01255 [Acidobacteriota bacterium]
MKSLQSIKSVESVASRNNNAVLISHFSVLSLMKRIIFWDHQRGTWQYDLFCLLIVAFIFLSPKAWFDNGELRATDSPSQAVQAPVTRD